MAAKRFGACLLAANSLARVMTGAAGHDSTATVVFCNQNTVPVRVWLAYVARWTDGATGTVRPEEWLRFNVEVKAGEALTVPGVAVEAGLHLIAKSSASNVSVVAYGFEEPA